MNDVSHHEATMRFLYGFVVMKKLSRPGVKKYRVHKIERPSIHRTLCQIVLYAPTFFVKVMLYSVDLCGKRTLSYGGLPIFLHRALQGLGKTVILIVVILVSHNNY